MRFFLRLVIKPLIFDCAPHETTEEPGWGFTCISTFCELTWKRNARFCSAIVSGLRKKSSTYVEVTFFSSDYLLSRIDGLPQVVDELESKFSSYRQDHKGRCICHWLHVLNESYCFGMAVSKSVIILLFSDAFACVRCVSSFSRHLGECILNAKATSHMAPRQEATGQTYCDQYHFLQLALLCPASIAVVRVCD